MGHHQKSPSEKIYLQITKKMSDQDWSLIRSDRA
jgi:hypothetical protein